MYLLNLDWLEVFGHLHQSPHIYRGEEFQFKLLPYGTRIYSQVWEVSRVYFSDKTQVCRRVATVCCLPCSPVLHPLAASIKLENSLLYTSEWKPTLIRLCEALGFEYISTTRIDIAADFNVLAGGRSPARLLQKLLVGDVLKVGKCEVRVVMGNDVAAEDGRPKPPSVQSMTWGSMSSGRQGIIYNKSLEMRQAKWKPWLRQYWERGGLDPEHVWRAEIRLKGNGKECRRFDGQPFFLGCDLIDEREELAAVFSSFSAKIFDFRRRTGRTRVYNMPRIVLFEGLPEPVLRPVHTPSDKTLPSSFLYLKSLLEQLDWVYRTAPEVEASDVRCACSELVRALRRALGVSGYLLSDRRIRPMVWRLMEAYNVEYRDIFAQAEIVAMARRGELELPSSGAMP